MEPALTKKQEYQCSFCGKPIASDPPEPLVLALQLPDGGTQALYSHRACLRTALHSSVPIAIGHDGRKA
jgi:hypothetical protein